MKRGFLAFIFLLSSLVLLAQDIEMPVSGGQTVVCGKGSLTHRKIKDNAISDLTIFPKKKGDMVRIVFTQFLLGSDDVLIIYNGPTFEARSLMGNYIGKSIPSTIVGTNSEGAISLRLITGVNSERNGFLAEVSNVECPSYEKLYLNTEVDSICPSVTFQLRLDLSTTLLPKTVWQKSDDGKEWKTIGEQGGAKLEVSQKSTSYYRVKYGCPTLTTDKVTNVVEVPIMHHLCYCNDQLQRRGVINIERVAIKGTTLDVASPETDKPHTVYPPKENNTAVLIRGREYELNVTTASYMVVFFWIDYNRNGQFEKEEYTIYNTISENFIPSKLHFRVPDNAALGLAGMRIRTIDLSEDQGDSTFDDHSMHACSNFHWGETEDYWVSIADPLPCSSSQPSVLHVKSSSDVVCPTRKFDLVLEGIADGTGAVVQWERQYADNPWEIIEQTNHRIVQVTQGKAYQYRCKVLCESQEWLSDSVKVHVDSTDCVYNSVFDEHVHINACSGVLMDNGGQNVYEPNGIDTVTIYPDLPNKRVILNFEQISLERNFDYLYASKDGSQTFDTLTGNVPSYQLMSEHESGAVTLLLLSDVYDTYNGFRARISCEERLHKQAMIKTRINWPLVCYGQRFELSLDSKFQGVSYQWQRKSIEGGSDGWEDLSHYSTGNNYVGNHLMPTIYRCKISDGSGVVVFSSELVVPISEAPCYCMEDLSTYGCGEVNQQNIINVSVVGSSLNNDSWCLPVNTGSNYSFFSPETGSTVELEAGTTYLLQVTCQQEMGVSAWLDVNADGSFAQDEWIQCSYTNKRYLHEGTMIVPQNAVAGWTRLRIRSRTKGYQNAGVDACTLFDSGETEDYLVTIKGVGSQSQRVESGNDELLLFPNPAKVSLEIYSTLDEKLLVTIVDMAGKQVLGPFVYQEGTSLNVSELKGGVYFLMAEGEGKKRSTLLVVEE